MKFNKSISFFLFEMCICYCTEKRNKKHFTNIIWRENHSILQVHLILIRMWVCANVESHRLNFNVNPLHRVLDENQYVFNVLWTFVIARGCFKSNYIAIEIILFSQFFFGNLMKEFLLLNLFAILFYFFSLK